MENLDLEFARTEVSTQEMDDLITEYIEARRDYETKKAVSDEAYHNAERLKARVLDLMEKAGKTKYEVEELGKATVVSKMKVRYPEDPTKRKAFLEWLRATKGEAGVLAYSTVNYMALQKLYNEEFDFASEYGNLSTFQIPGIDAPEVVKELRFSKARAK